MNTQPARPEQHLVKEGASGRRGKAASKWGLPVLFLFNDVVFSLGDPERAALSAGSPMSEAQLRALTLGKAVKLVREAVFDEPLLARHAPDKARFLAALIGWKSDEANALLAIRPNAARGPEDVQVRVASVGLMVLTQLKGLQEVDLLTARTANDAVWLHAPQRLRA
ncbi:MAG: hypothetical protein ACQRW7_03345 [Caulobacterales bacterium]|uniref:hypothetical protein n=1 Tax=Glycocaulis sp. TaxID=1969725 RepID=UPI003F9F5E46